MKDKFPQIIKIVQDMKAERKLKEEGFPIAPQGGESESEFISRCIAYEIRENGYEQSQAAAICYSKWRKK